MKTAKKLFECLIILLLIQSTFFSLISFASTKDDLTKLNSSMKAEAAIVMEASTGKIVYSKNSKKTMYPASTTKILTAIIALEKCSLTDMATASEHAITSIPSGYTDANIQVSETLSIEDLLYALMLSSANEAAVIIAEHISGSTEEFAKVMNEKAKEIGCENSNFVNPNGLHDKNHYSTAYDLALITKYAMKNETFRKIVSTVSYTLPATKVYPYETRTCTNSNKLIIVNKKTGSNNYYRDYVTGVKTGYTSPAGNCLVSSGNKNGLEFITVVLGEKAKEVRYIDTINMFDFAYNNYSFTKILSKNNTVTTVEVPGATDETKNLKLLANSEITALTSFDLSSIPEPQIELDENAKAPIKTGDVIGKVTYTIGEDSYSSDLIAANDVKEKILSDSKTIWKVILVIAIILLIITGILIKRKLKVDRIKYKKSRHLS